MAILVIVVIISLLAFRSRSKYAYPDASAAAKIQVTVSSSTASGTPGIITITTTSAHGYVAGDVFLKGSTPYVVLASPAPTNTPSPTFSVYGVTTDFTNGIILKPAYKTLSEALEQCNIDKQTGLKNDSEFATCVDQATVKYYSSMCPWTSAGNIPTTGSAPAASVTAYTTYTGSISSTAAGESVGKAYLGIKNAANTPMIAIANAARKADITGATRKYLSTVCPNYYVSATGTATPATYASWGVYASAQSGGSAPTYYFNASRVKFANANEKTSVADRLKEWSKYAAVYDTLNPGATPSTPLIAGCNLFSGTTGGIPNWKLAQQYGPGTVAGTNLPWDTAETTCNAAYGTYAAALN